MSLVLKLMGEFWKSNSKKDAKLRATQTEPQGIERIYDIPYIDDKDPRHMLDVYYPEGSVGRLPVIIDIHGGGWMANDKSFNRLYCLHLAKAGFTVFNINYRLTPAVTVVQQLQDCANALKWISLNMGSYPCDTENVILTGDSAGGQLALYTAALISSEKLRKIFKTADFDLPLKALALTSGVNYMNKCGVMGIYTRPMWGKDYKDHEYGAYMDFDDIAPYAEFPPTYLVTSSGDMLGRASTLKTAAKLREIGVEVMLDDYGKFDGRDLPHVFAVLRPESKEGAQQIGRMTEFFKKRMFASEH